MPQRSEENFKLRHYPRIRTSWMVGNTEVIFRRDLFVGELEDYWKIPASPVKHHVARRPSPGEFFFRNLALHLAFTPVANLRCRA